MLTYTTLTYIVEEKINTSNKNIYQIKEINNLNSGLEEAEVVITCYDRKLADKIVYLLNLGEENSIF